MSRAPRNCQPNYSFLEPIDENDKGWLPNALAPFAIRRRVVAQTVLFKIGAAAENNYYCVYSGQMLVHGKRTQSKPMIRLMIHGDMFAHALDGLHTADCCAVTDSIVLCIKKSCFASLAVLDPVLRDLGRSVDASELEFLFERPKGIARIFALHSVAGFEAI